MSKSKLSKDEQALLDAVEDGEFESILTPSRREELKTIASNTFKKDKRINIGISNRDLTAIQSRAPSVRLKSLLQSIRPRWTLFVSYRGIGSTLHPGD